MLAKEVVKYGGRLYWGCPLVVRQTFRALQQTESVALGKGFPKSRFTAEGTIATTCTRRQIKVAFKLECTTVTTAFVCFQHF
jgi:hypothetical protein